LHEQSYMSMRSYFTETRNLRPVMFDDCDVREGLKQGDVLFVNWESINKDNAVMIRDNEQNRTLYELLRRTQIQDGVPVVVVIDEEHMFAGRNAVKSEAVLRNINPKIELRVSATPQTMGDAMVSVQRSDVVAEQMIKKGVQLNPQMSSDREQQQLTINQRLLKRALQKREQLAEAYKQYGINPLLLIQLPNDSTEALSNDEKTIAEEMQAYLQAYHNITEDNGKLAIWLSKQKSPNLQTITNKADMTEVLLFKQAIALGWDCPRAAVLLIFRDVKSVTFTTQTVGRILRMPEQRHYDNELLNYGYVYTNIAANVIEIVADDMNYLSTVYANRRKDITNIPLHSTYLTYPMQKKNNLYASFKPVFLDTMSKCLDLFSPLLFDDSDFFEPEERIECHDTDVSDVILKNRDKARKHGIDLDVKNITVEIPKDTHLTGEAGHVEVVQRARLTRNASELDAIFRIFCKHHVHPYTTTDSAVVLKGAIEEAIERYLGYFSITDVARIVLYKRNTPVFEDIIKRALNAYQRKEERANETRVPLYEKTIWSVPETRMYNAAQVQSAPDIYLHAVMPYLEQKHVSKPEYDFARWIDRQSDKVDWWYKNGDDGKQHFAVPYTDPQGGKHCFYVDFIVRLKNGTVCLFDTKTEGSDIYGAEKNNALWQYCKEKHLIGGVLIQKDGNWYYPNGIIETTTDTGGWSRLDLNNI
ncbi:MAG: DEAD/DEAH box helicase family protein, partial [Paludibacteraceae bacterium]|nr:DEAD/DEAH box helicase family protein [Paludibacteraceae bacterium]